ASKSPVASVMQEPTGSWEACKVVFEHTFVSAQGVSHGVLQPGDPMARARAEVDLGQWMAGRGAAANLVGRIRPLGSGPRTRRRRPALGGVALPLRVQFPRRGPRSRGPVCRGR